MAKKKTRKKLKEEPEKKSTYFKEDDDRVRGFVPTGATVLDCALGGGYAFGKIINIVGDPSTSKTGSGIEATANFLEHYPQGKVVYAEAEAAFDKAYAESLGMPVDRIEFREEENNNEVVTVEDLYTDLKAVCEASREGGQPTLYILDSLDALSDEAEMERNIDEGTYGASKARKLSELLRRITKELNKSNVTFIVISQTRDNINAQGFGKKYSRSGGKSLDFYASQIIYLAHIQYINKQVRGVKKPIGIQVRAKITKNKTGVPFRQCDYPYIFNYGIDDVEANVDWLNSNNLLGEVTDKKKVAYLNDIDKLGDEEYQQEAEKLSSKVREAWTELEEDFAPKRRKYSK